MNLTRQPLHPSLTKVSGSTSLNQNRAHNKANEITDITESTGPSWPTPTHDAAGNMTLTPRPLSLANSFDLKWDAWNRLVEVKNTGGSVVATYRYDGANRRVTKASGGNTRHYYYSDQWQILEEDLETETEPVFDKRFVWGIRSIDDLILRDDTSLRLYALSDAMGSVTAVVNTSGTVQERYGYDGFGQPRYMDASFGSRGSSSYGWETLFDGYRYDLESGLYHVRYRYLHPRLGRWASRDPLGELYFALAFWLFSVVQSRPLGILWVYLADINVYACVLNKPGSSIDIDGLGIRGICEFFISAPEQLKAQHDYEDAVRRLNERYGPGNWPDKIEDYMEKWKWEVFGGTIRDVVKPGLETIPGRIDNPGGVKPKPRPR